MNALAPIPKTRARDSRIFERHADDWYVEEAWVWTRLFEHIALPPGLSLHDPACGGGTCVEAATAAGFTASGSDVVARWQFGDADNLMLGDFRDGMPKVSVIASNPPFKLARAFVGAALPVAPIVCLLLPATWGCGDRKARWLKSTPLSDILFLTPRPKMRPGLGLLPGQKLGGGTKDFAIFIWVRDRVEPARVGWLHRDGATTKLGGSA